MPPSRYIFLSLTLLPVHPLFPSISLSFIFVSPSRTCTYYPSPSQMYPLLLSSTPSSTLTFQLRVPALPRSHSSRFSSPPTVHRFNHEYLLPSRSIRIVGLASFDPSYNFLSFFPCLPRFTARSVSFPFSAAIAFLLHSSGCSTIFPLPVFRPTRSAFLFLWLSFYLGKALSSVKNICLCSDTNLNLFFLSLSLSQSFYPSLFLSTLGGGSLLSLFSLLVFARSNPRVLFASTTITWFQH